jgi:uncharacterized membrane protein
MKYRIYVGLLVASLLFPSGVFAQSEIVPDDITIEKARVIEVTNARDTIIPGTDTPAKVQTLTVEVVSGVEKGKIVTFDNDYIQLESGDLFYVRHISNEFDVREFWSVADPYRLDVLIVVAVVFLALLFAFGGLQGVRGLASLLGSLVLIFYVLLPGILHGYSPILVSIGVASLIIIIGSYITHGFNRTTTTAVVAMILTVVVTGLSAYYVIQVGNLSGYTADENVYLNFNTRGAIDMVGLLFGGIMIGLLGVLYDVAIGQAVAVEELFRAGKHMTRLDIYRRGIRIGREHIGALVNTLAIAYVGVALPLLLLIQHSTTMGFGFLLNSEIFATEVVRVLIGSIGIILAVPITTFIASYMLSGVQGIPGGGSQAHHH